MVRFSQEQLYTSVCVVAMLLLLGCEQKPAGKRYELEGRVVAVDSGSRLVTVAHQEVAGLMPAMTMPFQVGHGEEWVFGKMAPGDHIHATLVMTDHAELQDISFSHGSDSAGDGTSQLRIPEAGDEVPDFRFVNQTGKSISIRQFRGKPLLLTFIYTRCPLPDFCPRMSNNFRGVLQRLEESPAAFAKAQLLSLSIDPEFDTPKVLRAYGSQYGGKIDPRFEHWEFATGSPEVMRKAADFFGLAYNTKDGQIVHSLRTVLIGADGRIAKVYPGNSWTPSDLARDFVDAASGQ
jgi:protein SCO1/2